MRCRFFNALTLLSLLVFLATVLLGAGTSAVWTDHWEVYLFQRPVGGFLRWFLRGDLNSATGINSATGTKPVDLLMAASMVPPVMKLYLLADRLIARYAAKRAVRT